MSEARALDAWDRALIGTATGRLVHPLRLCEDDIQLQDIVVALSHTGRFAGHTRVFWSVLQHSIEVSIEVERLGGDATDQIWALLHDAGEAYLLDIPSPIKPLLMFAAPGQGVPVEYVEAEFGILQRVAERFGLPFPLPGIVHEADHAVTQAEALQFMPGAERWADAQAAEPIRTLEAADPETVRYRFRARMEELAYKRMGGE